MPRNKSEDGRIQLKLGRSLQSRSCVLQPNADGWIPLRASRQLKKRKLLFICLFIYCVRNVGEGGLYNPRSLLSLSFPLVTDIYFTKETDLWKLFFDGFISR